MPVINKKKTGGQVNKKTLDQFKLAEEVVKMRPSRSSAGETLIVRSTLFCGIAGNGAQNDARAKKCG